ncbi:hypothetical protein ACFVYR_34990 [Streptomyces sp. NPDC058284]|uniref:hypothetical protein n=1 Tax=unclassified Streptomyces TaxID=2593676 RepID=UPI0036602F53
MTREEFQAQCDAEEATFSLEAEVRQISRNLDRLYRAMAAGDTSQYTRQRIRRTEALLAALQGFPAAMAT